MSSDISMQCYFANSILHGYTELGRFSMNLSDRLPSRDQRGEPTQTDFEQLWDRLSSLSHKIVCSLGSLPQSFTSNAAAIRTRVVASIAVSVHG